MTDVMNGVKTITAHDAAQLLKVSGSTVRSLIRYGVLKDYKRRSTTAKKHFALVDASAVEVLKEYVDFSKLQRVDMYNAKKIKTALRGKVQTFTAVTPNGSTQSGSMQSGPGKLSMIERRLSVIEAKVDKLIQMWS
jgi:hypothetical protein